MEREFKFRRSGWRKFESITRKFGFFYQASRQASKCAKYFANPCVFTFALFTIPDYSVLFIVSVERIRWFSKGWERERECVCKMRSLFLWNDADSFFAFEVIRMLIDEIDDSTFWKWIENSTHHLLPHLPFCRDPDGGITEVPVQTTPRHRHHHGDGSSSISSNNIQVSVRLLAGGREFNQSMVEYSSAMDLRLTKENAYWLCVDDECKFMVINPTAGDFQMRMSFA